MLTFKKSHLSNNGNEPFTTAYNVQQCLFKSQLANQFSTQLNLTSINEIKYIKGLVSLLHNNWDRIKEHELINGKDKVNIDLILQVCESLDIHADYQSLNYLCLLSYNYANIRGILTPNTIIIDQIPDLYSKDVKIDTI